MALLPRHPDEAPTLRSVQSLALVGTCPRENRAKFFETDVSRRILKTFLVRIISDDGGKSCIAEKQIVASKFPLMGCEIEYLDEMLKLIQDTQVRHRILWGAEESKHSYTLTQHTDEAEVAKY